MTGSLAADSGKSILSTVQSPVPFLAILFAAATACIAQTAEQAWLRYNSNSPRMIIPMNMRALGTSALEQSAISELKRSEADVAQSGQSARTKDAFCGRDCSRHRSKFARLTPAFRSRRSRSRRVLGLLQRRQQTG